MIIAACLRKMDAELKGILLALSLAVSFSLVHSRAINNTECSTDSNIVKQKTQKFYCIATMLYEKLQMVRQIQCYTTAWYICTYVYIHHCMC